MRGLTVADRDPRAEPQFGDVFRFDGEDYPWTVFLCRGEGRSAWWGLDLYPANAGRLNTPRVTDFDSLPTDDGWSFVEHIDGHAAGGPVPFTLALTPKELFEMPKADYDRLVSELASTFAIADTGK